MYSILNYLFCVVCLCVPTHAGACGGQLDVLNQSLPLLFFFFWWGAGSFTETGLWICLDWLASCACFYGNFDNTFILKIFIIIKDPCVIF